MITQVGTKRINKRHKLSCHCGCVEMILDLPKQSKYVNIGDWIAYFTYGVLENGIFKLEELFDKK